MDTNSVTNLTYLKDLAKGDETFVKEMISIFLTENPEEIKQLEQAIEEISFEKIRSISHHMKSTIPFVGLDKHISSHLLKIEHLAAKKKEIEIIKTHFTHVKLVCQQAFQELKA